MAMGLLVRAVLAFVALPGLVAFAIPLLLLVSPSDVSRGFDPPGLVLLVGGSGLLLGCVREFYVAGAGTLAPWSPPRALVVSGPYRVSRNPMYVAVILVLVGWAIGFRSRSVAIYALAVTLAFHVRVVLGEEPWLARVHGDDWVRYRAHVPRWLGIPRGGG